MIIIGHDKVGIGIDISSTPGHCAQLGILDTYGILSTLDIGIVDYQITTLSVKNIQSHLVRLITPENGVTNRSYRATANSKT